LVYSSQKAFTLLELLITLTIFSILTLSCVYYYQHHNSRTKLSLFVQQFYADLSYAKEHAVSHNQIVTVCPINTHWENGYKITVNNASPFLIRTPLYSSDQKIQTHFGLNHTCLFFNSQGHSVFNGHISYFYDSDKLYAKIILTQTGKMHLEIH